MRYLPPLSTKTTLGALFLAVNLIGLIPFGLMSDDTSGDTSAPADKAQIETIQNALKTSGAGIAGSDPIKDLELMSCVEAQSSASLKVALLRCQHKRAATPGPDGHETAEPMKTTGLHNGPIHVSP